jgi:hypothetical protein
MHRSLTCYSLDQTGSFPVDKVNDVPLGRVGVAILKLENLVHAVFFQSRKLHKQTEQAGQFLANNEVLSASYLRPY